MKNKIRWGLRAVFLLIFICSIFLIYNWYYDYFKSAPSERWAKEVKIAEGADIDKSKVLKVWDKSVVIYNEKENVKVLLVDKIGKVIKNVVIKTDDDFNIDMNLTTDGKIVYASWIKSKSGQKYMETHEFDQNLNHIKKTVDTGVQFSKTIDSEDILLSYKDKLLLKNLKDNKITEIKLSSTIASAIKTKDGYIIASLMIIDYLM